MSTIEFHQEKKNDNIPLTCDLLVGLPLECPLGDISRLGEFSELVLDVDTQAEVGST